MNEEIKSKIEELQQELAKKQALERLQRAANHFESFGYNVTVSITEKETETEENK